MNVHINDFTPRGGTVARFPLLLAVTSAVLSVLGKVRVLEASDVEEVAENTKNN